MSSRERIADHLSSLARAWRRAEIREKTLFSGSIAVVAMVVGLVCAQLGWTSAGLSLIGTAIVFVAIAAIVVATRTLAKVTGETMKLARLAEHLSPDLGTGPTSAVDLAKRLQSAEFRNVESFSPELAEAHLDEMADALGRARLVERLEAERRERDRRAWKVLGSCVLLLLIAIVSLSTGRARLATWLADPTAARISESPLASDITLRYAFPAYTGLQSRIVEGGDGSISAVVGTQVDLSATADMSVRSGVLKLFGSDGKAAQDVPLAIDDKKIAATIPVLRDGSYAFELVTNNGERLQDGLRHPIRATLDTSPEIFMDSPTGDVELKDDHSVDILWRAKDDYGVGDVELVIETESAAEPKRVALAAGASANAKTREGQYRWSVAELGIKPGEEVRFHLETVDNDTINGPKKGSSETHRLTIFSARQRHEDLLDEQRQLLDDMVSLLGDELENPFPRDGDWLNAKAKQYAIVDKTQAITRSIEMLTASLRDDKMSTPQIIAAFDNVREHLTKSHNERVGALQFLGKNAAPQTTRKNIADRQTVAVKQLEKDILYLDDLLAVQRINELKETARDLLSAQRELQKLFEEYTRTKDPALQAELQKRIAELKDKMMGLLQKMAQIKEHLPGEYRNMESASMLQMDDQLARLDKMLREGKIDEAAAELEQLANAVENMMNSMNEAEREFGGERYDGLRKELAEFAQEFREIEKEQRDLAEKSEEILKEYRKEAAKRAGRSVDEMVKKAREKTAEALRELDKIANEGPPMQGHLRNAVDSARQRLIDMDSLLEQRDFSEARAAGQSAEDREREAQGMLNDRVPYGGRDLRAAQEQAAKAAERAAQRTGEVNAMLDKLFPDPSQVLSPEQQAQMQRNQRRQQQLEQQARALSQKMDQLSQDVPLFGGESRRQLENARGEMDKAIGQMQGGHLPGAASSERRAADELGKLREQLERASQGGGGQLPLPLAGGGGHGHGRDNGQSGMSANQEVQIPQSDKNRAAPRFRQELLEAAKQKAPQNYEDAVRKYYEELIK